MIYTHPLAESQMDLASYIRRHSGDRTFAYRQVDGQGISMSIYNPPDFNPGNTYPAFLFVHGGGWRSRKIFDGEGIWQGDYLGYLARYYADRGYVSISIDYRLASSDGQMPQYQLIDCYDDCATAVDYILDHAASLGINTGYVNLLGESAGGHLAGLLATRYQRPGFRFQRAFLVNAITDLDGDKRWNPLIPKASTHPALASHPREDFGKLLSPLYGIRENNCPVVLIHGKADSVVEPFHSTAFYSRMREVGAQCQLHWIEETNHAFLLAEYTSNLAACKIGIRIIDQYL